MSTRTARIIHKYTIKQFMKVATVHCIHSANTTASQTFNIFPMMNYNNMKAKSQEVACDNNNM